MHVLVAAPRFPQQRIARMLWGLDVTAADHVDAAAARLREREFDLVLVSINLHESRLEALERVIGAAGASPVVVIRSAQGRYRTSDRSRVGLDAAVRALGARGFVDFFAASNAGEDDEAIRRSRTAGDPSGSGAAHASWSWTRLAKACSAPRATSPPLECSSNA